MEMAAPTSTEAEKKPKPKPKPIRMRSIKELAAVVKTHENVACLFYETHRDTYTKLMDKYMEELAARHPNTRFLKIYGPKHPNLGKKLAIQKYPTIILLKNTRLVDRLVGSEFFSAHQGGVSTDHLERIMFKHKIVPSACDHKDYTTSDEMEDRRMMEREKCSVFGCEYY